MIPWTWFALVVFYALAITVGAFCDALRSRRIARLAVEQLRQCLAEQAGIPLPGDTRKGDGE